MTAARLRRYATFLVGLNYTIEFSESRRHGKADPLQLLPLIAGDANESGEANFSHWRRWRYFRWRMPASVGPWEGIHFFLVYISWPVRGGRCIPRLRNWHRFTIHQRCLIWGGRIIVSQKLRQRILDQLHEAHSRVVKMKSLPRSCVWWPGIDAEIEEITKGCQVCLNIRKNFIFIIVTEHLYIAK